MTFVLSVEDIFPVFLIRGKLSSLHPRGKAIGTFQAGAIKMTILHEGIKLMEV